MPTQYAVPAIVAAFVAAFILGAYTRSKLAAAGKLVDALIADDPWDVQIGDVDEAFDSLPAHDERRPSC
jgi:hypothetical protein